MADAISAKTAWALAKAIKGGSKRKGPTNGTATVVRVDQDGTHWVRISGSDVETPVNGAITVDAKAGDTVQYHLEDTRISITGNATSPSVGGTYVSQAVAPVERKANTALAEASRAKEAADTAESEAYRAHVAADAAQTSADDATAAASTASTAAQSALLGLSTVEDVVDVLAWLSAHSKATEDTSVVDGKAYYTRDATTGAMARVTTIPEDADPSALGWWEMDDAVTQYLAAHIAMTDHGLNLMVDGTSGYIHLGTLDGEHEYGTYIIDGDGVSEANFGEHTRIGRGDGMHVDITSDATASDGRLFSIADGTSAPVMYVQVVDGESTVYMTNAVVVRELRFGDWMWYERQNGNMSVKWTGSGA